MAERISRRQFLGATGAAGGSALLGWIVSDGIKDEQDLLMADNSRGNKNMAEKLGNLEFWRAMDTSDYKNIEISEYPALILVKSGQYEGIRLHTGGKN